MSKIEFENGSSITPIEAEPSVRGKYARRGSDSEMLVLNTSGSVARALSHVGKGHYDAKGFGV